MQVIHTDTYIKQQNFHFKMVDITIENFDLNEAAPSGTNTQINIGDAWKEISAAQINIGDTWKAVAGMQINIGDSWKEVF